MTKEQLIELVSFTAGEIVAPTELSIEDAESIVDDFVDTEQLTIPVVGWRSEQLPDFDVDEINEIVKDCKDKKEDLQALVCRIWNKGYMTAVADEREG